jgi:hypothetical protein
VAVVVDGVAVVVAGTVVGAAEVVGAAVEAGAAVVAGGAAVVGALGGGAAECDVPHAPASRLRATTRPSVGARRPVPVPGRAKRRCAGTDQGRPELRGVFMSC